MRAIELLAPARNLECGIEAIRHGADAVYIGAPRFGARAAAGNSVEDIARLVAFARPFGVRIYVTLNTLLRDDELPAAEALIRDLAAIPVDALIVQDPRILASDSRVAHTSSSDGRVANIFVRSSLPLHSSTQMDNRTIEDVRARLAAGYSQTVLARELSLEDIRAIHAAVPEMPLEVFVHGALCVSYSGRCYASEYCFQRSANRGECAQFCRLPFDLVDADGHLISVPGGSPLRQRHLLSLRDMNRSADLEALLDAGVTSLKIEGRLKDVSYVKNITAFYRQRLDAIFLRRPEDFCRASFGTVNVSFTPDPQKSFNRGFTDYFLHTRTASETPASAPLHQHLTPKSLGEPLGTVQEISSPFFILSASITINNGDGLCFFTPDGHLQGFRINRADAQGRLFPADPAVLSLLRRGTPVFRNLDAAFERQLSRPTAERRIPVRWLLEDSAEGFRLSVTTLDARSLTVSRFFPLPLELARTPQTENIRRQLLRLGDTPFSTTAEDITLHLSDNWFIPASTLAEWRRQVTEELCHFLTAEEVPAAPTHPAPFILGAHCGSAVVALPLMTCRYCIRQSLGLCTKSPAGQRQPLKEPLSLVLADGRRFPLRFDCKNCQMLVLAPDAKS